MSNTERPLWEVMDDAYLETCLAKGYIPRIPACGARAAELRAIADWLVPEEPPHPDVFPSSPGNVVDIAMCSQRGQRQDIRAKLLAEADRAESGG